jgi:nitrile hydratase
MNGVHDMGGMHGMGPIVHEEDEPVFHHAWERRAFAITFGAGALELWNLDMTRYAREVMPPAEYLAATYYERWVFGLERLLVEKGLLAREEIASRMAALRGEPR